jgi:DNA-binding NarL/FixJ family response regulator
LSVVECKARQMNKIRIYLVDDEPVVLRGLQLFLGRQPGMEIVGSAESVSIALVQAPALGPDIIVLDLTLRDGDGFRMISEFRASCPRARLLVFSMHAERAFIEAAIQAGADDYVVKEEGPEKLLQALDRLITQHCHDLEGMSYTVLPIGADPKAMLPRAAQG